MKQSALKKMALDCEKFEWNQCGRIFKKLKRQEKLGAQLTQVRRAMQYALENLSNKRSTS